MDKHGALERHFSTPRLRPYLQRASGNQSHALELYRWNSALAAAFFVDLGHLEVGLRNAVDARMTARHRLRGLPGTWLDDPAGELGRDLRGNSHRRPYRDIHGARNRVRQNDKALTHGQVLSETPFGLWHQLVSKRWTPLWPDLADASRTHQAEVERSSPSTHRR